MKRANHRPNKIKNKADQATHQARPATLLTGAHAQDLRSTCGASFNRIPVVIAIVVRMLFGNLTEPTMQKFLRCSETYTKASDRWSVHLRAHLQKEFNSEEVHGATLITDASNTRNKEVELVVITFVEHNSSGQRQLLRSVDLLAAASKKSSIMADTVMTTVCQCIGTSVHKVDSMITDAASNAVTEAKKLTALIDAEVVSRGRGCAPD